MAQFVTHIQPTLIEASHHHAPMHHHKEVHYPKELHHKEHKDHKDHKYHDESGRSHKDHKDLESHYKDLQMHQGHPRDFPVLPHHQPLTYKDFAESHAHYEEGKSDGHKRNSGHYVDSHGVSHEFQLHFIDSQGIYRDYHGHAIEIEGHHHKEHDHFGEKYNRERLEKQKAHEEKHKEKPIPPQFIDLHGTPQLENKKVSFNININIACVISYYF